jgi:DNA-binding transcriptional regulator YdaS (Cro superfamily)
MARIDVNSEQSLLIWQAIQIAGSQKRLANECGCSQQLISSLATGERAVKAELAHKIDSATNGRVPKHKLRPDIFDPPAKQEARP